VITVIRVGDWDLAQKIVSATRQQLKGALRTAVRQEAEDCRTAMVEGIISQAPGGQAFKPLARSTILRRQWTRAGGAIRAGAKRERIIRGQANQRIYGAAATGDLRGAQRAFSTMTRKVAAHRMRTSWKVIGKAGGTGTKALINTGDLVNSIRAIHQGDRSFIGVLRTARTRDGKSLVNVASIHEFGVGPKAVVLTAKARRFLAVMYRQMGIPPKVGKGGGGTVTIRIPARPFVRPVFKMLFGNHREAGARIVQRLSALLPLQAKP
jgi:hypothetical protein